MFNTVIVIHVNEVVMLRGADVIIKSTVQFKRWMAKADTIFNLAMFANNTIWQILCFFNSHNRFSFVPVSSLYKSNNNIIYIA